MSLHPGEQLAENYFQSERQRAWKRTDRMFAGLMVLQWLAGIGMALWVTPYTWVGAVSSVHVHVFAAIFLGGGIAAFPVLLVLTCPGHSLTRHVIAASEMLASALLIHLSGGRIETHFHIFGSLIVNAAIWSPQPLRRRGFGECTLPKRIGNCSKSWERHFSTDLFRKFV